MQSTILAIHADAAGGGARVFLQTRKQPPGYRDEYPASRHEDERITVAVAASP